VLGSEKAEVQILKALGRALSQPVRVPGEPGEGQVALTDHLRYLTGDRRANWIILLNKISNAISSADPDAPVLKELEALGDSL
jgi:hypothetical protein